jgi:hypothetical protein
MAVRNAANCAFVVSCVASQKPSVDGVASGRSSSWPTPNSSPRNPGPAGIQPQPASSAGHGSTATAVVADGAKPSPRGGSGSGTRRSLAPSCSA